MTVTFQGRNFFWQFLQYAVSFPILGMVFLKHCSLLVDLVGRQLLLAHHWVLVPTHQCQFLLWHFQWRQQSPPQVGCAPIVRAAPVYQCLLIAYSDILNPSKQLPPTKHSVEHHIETTGRPVSSHFFQLDTAKMEAS